MSSASSGGHQPQPSHFVYIVECADGTLYTGYTINIDRRILAHNAGKGARYTRAHRPVKLLVSWVFSTKSEALRMEATIKRLSRPQKLHLIEQGLPSEIEPPL